MAKLKDKLHLGAQQLVKMISDVFLKTGSWDIFMEYSELTL